MTRFAACVIAAGGGALLGLTLTVAVGVDFDVRPQRPPEEAPGPAFARGEPVERAAPDRPARPPPVGVLVGGERRVPVAGSEDVVVFAPDGAVYLESRGQRKRLADPEPGGPPPDAAEAVAARVAARAQARRPPAETRLVVLDRGVVAVPVGWALTYQGGDHAVAVGPDGSATAFYTDGRVEERRPADR